MRCKCTQLCSLEMGCVLVRIRLRLRCRCHEQRPNLHLPVKIPCDVVCDSKHCQRLRLRCRGALSSILVWCANSGQNAVMLWSWQGASVRPSSWRARTGQLVPAIVHCHLLPTRVAHDRPICDPHFWCFLGFICCFQLSVIAVAHCLHCLYTPTIHCASPPPYFGPSVLNRSTTILTLKTLPR